MTPAQALNVVAPFRGVIEWKGQPSQGVSQQTGNPWANVDFVLKYIGQNMREELILFTLSGPERVNALMATPIGTEVKVWWRPGARPWTDQMGQVKYFGQNAAYAVQPVAPETDPAQVQQMPAQQIQVSPSPAQQYVQQQAAQPVYQQAPAQALAQAPVQAPATPPAAPAQGGYNDLPF